MNRRIALVSTYPPCECGIATYTKDLFDALSCHEVRNPPVVTAIDENNFQYRYGEEVEYLMEKELVDSYVKAAEFINDSDIDVVSLQHEFGLFGGTWGEYIISFLEELEKPIVTTLHTLKLKPEEEERRVLKKILHMSDYVVVMAKAGIRILDRLYGIPTSKLRFIAHGCPDVPFISSERMKKHLGLKDRVVLSTFGLLSRGKGIEYAIRALPTIVEEEPQTLYLVIGETHPKVKKNEGERYREKLVELVKSLRLKDNVRFINSFLPLKDIIQYLQATDLYLIPYPNREQISSGTLLYALSTGKAIVSTPFILAEEVISKGCAMRCEFRDSNSISECVRTLLKHNYIRKGLEKKAYKFSRDKTWQNAAMKYLRLFNETLELRDLIKPAGVHHEETKELLLVSENNA